MRLLLKLLAPAVLALWLVSCAYRIEIVQGSILTGEDIARLELGMNKEQVEYILGTPNIIDSLNPNRWDYIFRTKKGRQTSLKKGYVIFLNERLAEIHMDEFLP